MFQIALPVFVSMAISRPSSVPMNSVSPTTATPRLFDPQQTRASGEGVCRYNQNTRPVFASTASTSFGRCVTYMTPSTTSGDDCHAPNTWLGRIHFISRFFTLVRSSCFSGL